MSLAERIDQLLADSRNRLAAEMRTPGQAPARGYARALCALENDLHVHHTEPECDTETDRLRRSMTHTEASDAALSDPTCDASSPQGVTRSAPTRRVT